ncbi:BTB/POZ domain-containing protein [Ditylenchus destructor]|nr:BTB/POZ domain-containing protein [Ditylenchus destructor]
MGQVIKVVVTLMVSKLQNMSAIENGPLFSSSTKYPWDFVLIIQGNEVHVQKSILSLHSEYFKDQFGKHKREKRAILEDVDYDEFIELLSIIYRTGCSITEENVETISKLALKFKMAGLLRECEAFLMEHTTNVGRAKALSMAESYGLVYLQGKVIDEIKNIADIKNMKPELDTLSNRTKRMLLDRICSSGPAFKPVSGPQNIGITTSRATEILEELASSACTATDGFLIVENNRIPIHKAYLAMCSEYFRAMFQGEFTERNQDEVVLEEFRYGEILELLAVIYHTDSTITDQNIEVILKTAEYFNMPRILAQCKKFLQNSKEISAARKLWLAQRYHLPDLQAEYAKKYKKITEVEKLRAEPEYVLFDDKTRALILDSLTS